MSWNGLGREAEAGEVRFPVAARLGTGALATMAIVLLLAAPAAASGGQPLDEVASTEVARRAAAGESVDLRQVTLTGDLDLTPIGSLSQPLRCQGCHLTGSLRASDVVFQRMVDFSDSIVEGSVDFRGTVFEDRVRFDGTDVRGQADFTASQFVAAASFSRGSFGLGVTFVAADFTANADFAQRCFGACEPTPVCDGAPGDDGPANFEGAVLAGGASFVLAHFADRGNWRGVELRQGARFLGACFNEGADLSLAGNAGPIDFNGALISGPLDLSNMVSTGTISLVGIRPFDNSPENDHPFRLTMEQLSVDELSMEVATVNRVVGPKTQEDVLELIEQSAQDDQNLALANDARYQRLSRQGADKESWRLTDWLLYRGVAGYLVRPSHPLVALLAALMIATGVRVGYRWRTSRRQDVEGPAGSRPRWAILKLERALAVVCGSLARSLRVVVRPKINPDDATIGGGDERITSYLLVGARWVEFLVYKVLLAVLLLTLANSYATVRQIIDAV